MDENTNCTRSFEGFVGNDLPLDSVMPRVRIRMDYGVVSPYSLLGPTCMLSYYGVAAQHTRSCIQNN